MPSKSSNPSAKAGSELSARQRVDAYATYVTSGEVLAGPWVRLACERHLRDVSRQGTGDFTYLFDDSRADHAVDFFEDVLRLPDLLDEDGNPRAFLLEPWQVFIIGSLFGWVDALGRRRFREAYMEIGKGNGKTPMCAGIGLYGLVMDCERAAEIYAAAADQEQAAILFRDAVRIVEASPDLAEIITPSGGEHIWKLDHKPSLSFFRTFSRESGSKSGTRPHMGLLDELHEHGTPQISIKVRAGAKRRDQPLFVEITNSGFDRTSICWEHHEHSRKVVQGFTPDEQWFAYVCALDEGDDPLRDESCWLKVNPNLDVSVPRTYLRTQVKNALGLPGEQNTVLRLNFCVWTEQDERWLDMHVWDACGATVDIESLRGRECYAGLDLASTRDVTAFVLVFPDDDGTFDVLPYFWVPKETMHDRVSRDRVPYDVWAREGNLRTTDGNVCDYDRVREDIREIAEQFDIREIAYDRWGATQLVTQLTADGANMFPLGQGFASLSSPTKELDKLIASQSIRHGKHPVLRWMAGNVAIEQDAAGNIKPSKKKSTEKIDGIVALVMALDRASRQSHGSVYDTEGVFVV